MIYELLISNTPPTLLSPNSNLSSSAAKHSPNRLPPNRIHEIPRPRSPTVCLVQVSFNLIPKPNQAFLIAPLAHAH